MGSVGRVGEFCVENLFGFTVDRMAKKDEGMSPNVMLLIGLVACGGLVVIAVVATRLMGSTEEVHKRTAPVAAPVAQSVNQTPKYSSGYYKASWSKRDAAKKWATSSPARRTPTSWRSRFPTVTSFRHLA